MVGESTMTKDEKIKLLTDNTKTDAEIASLLNLSIGYLSVLRQRWKINKKRGNKAGTIRQGTIFINCKTCNKEVKKNLSNKTKQYCSVKCMFNSEEYIEKLSSANKEYMQTEAYSNSIKKEDTPEYKKYSNRVQTLTRKNYIFYKEEINPENLPRGVAGRKGSYHLDHKISVRYGFDNNISPDVIADKSNLQMLPWRENVIKGKKNC
jgi:hypothetical protein